MGKPVNSCLYSKNFYIKAGDLKLEGVTNAWNSNVSTNLKYRCVSVLDVKLWTKWNKDVQVC